MPLAHFSGHSSPALSASPPCAHRLHLPITKTAREDAGVSLSLMGQHGLFWRFFIIHACPPPLHRSRPPSSLFHPSIPSSALLLSQRAMDLLEGITEKARRYCAYILMDTMQAGGRGRGRDGGTKGKIGKRGC